MSLSTFNPVQSVPRAGDHISDKYTVRLRTANSNLASTAQLDALSKSKALEIVVAVAANSSAPKKVLTRLARSRDESVRYAVRNNLSATRFQKILAR